MPERQRQVLLAYNSASGSNLLSSWLQRTPAPQGKPLLASALCTAKSKQTVPAKRRPGNDTGVQLSAPDALLRSMPSAPPGQPFEQASNSRAISLLKQQLDTQLAATSEQRMWLLHQAAQQDQSVLPAPQLQQLTSSFENAPHSSHDWVAAINEHPLNSIGMVQGLDLDMVSKFATAAVQCMRARATQACMTLVFSSVSCLRCSKFVHQCYQRQQHRFISHGVCCEIRLFAINALIVLLCPGYQHCYLPHSAAAVTTDIRRRTELQWPQFRCTRPASLRCRALPSYLMHCHDSLKPSVLL